jgi:hypothetical protein
VLQLNIVGFINVVYDVKIYMLIISHNGMASIKYLVERCLKTKHNFFPSHPLKFVLLKPFCYSTLHHKANKKMLLNKPKLNQTNGMHVLL